MTPLPEGFRLSQSALRDYLDCPRRFELRYLIELAWPAVETEPALEHEARIRAGSQLHFALYQAASGVEPADIRTGLTDPQVREPFSGALNWLERTLPAERHAELMLTAPLDDVLLVAKLDLLTRDADGRFTIVDWKTGASQPAALLQRQWQTRLYPYLLVRAGAWLNDDQPIAPPDIHMIYWYGDGGETQSFTYSTERYIADEADLRALLSEINRRDTFPLTEDTRACRFCAYRSLCDRGVSGGAEADPFASDAFADANALQLSLDDIDEISL